MQIPIENRYICCFNPPQIFSIIPPNGGIILPIIPPYPSDLGGKNPRLSPHTLQIWGDNIGGFGVIPPIGGIKRSPALAHGGENFPPSLSPMGGIFFWKSYFPPTMGGNNDPCRYFNYQFLCY